MSIGDVLSGIRSRVKAIDEQLAAEVTNALSEATAAIDDIPLKGIVPAAMRAIEERGLAICKTRLAEIKAEIRRLEDEAANTEAIIAAGVAKVEILMKHEKGQAEKASMPAAVDPAS